MEEVEQLTPVDLCQRYDPDYFTFETTAELEALTDVIGRPRHFTRFFVDIVAGFERY